MDLLHKYLRKLMHYANSSVAVIITSFNSSAYVGQAVESVLTQTKLADEIVLVDNGSSDLTVPIAANYPIRILINTQPGVGASRSLGLAETNSKLIKFLDADDVLMDDAIESLHSQIEASGCDLIYGKMCNFLDSKDNLVSKEQTSENVSSPMALTSLLTRESIYRFGGFLDDQFSWMRWYLKSIKSGLQVGTTSQLVGLRRVHDGNFSKSGEYWKEIISILRDSSGL